LDDVLFSLQIGVLNTSRLNRFVADRVCARETL